MQLHRFSLRFVFVMSLVAVSTAVAGEREERFYAAARSGDLAAIKQLVADGVDVNAANQYGATALSFAADKGHIEVVRFLLDKGANPNQSDTFYHASPMTWASENEHWEVAALLAAHGAEGADDLFIQVARTGQTKVVKQLLESGKLKPVSLSRALMAAGEAQPEIVALLVKAGAKPLPKLSAELLEEYVGKYELQPGFVLDVRRNDDQLVVQATGQPEFPIFAESETKFFLTVVEATVEFQRNAEGKVDRLILNQGGREMPCMRQGEVAVTPIDTAAVEKYVGKYESPEGVEFVVAIQDGQLCIGPEGNLKPLISSGDDTFYPVSNAGLKIIFEMKDGKAIGYTVDTGTEKFKRTRVAAPEVVAAAVPTKRYPPGEPMNWPSFRGPHSAGVGDGQRAPVEWNAETGDHVKWKTAIPGLGHSSPVVWRDRVFVTTAISSDPNAVFRAGAYGDVKSANDNSPHEWKVYCLDAKTGKIIWQKTAHQGIPRSQRHTKASYASCTPATDGTHVVVNFGSEGLYGYDFDGKLLWETDLGTLDAGWFYDPTYQWGYSSSPAIHDNLAIVQADVNSESFIAAYDINTGKQVWRTARDEVPSWGTPVVVESGGRAQVVANATKHICGYDPRTGKELWRLSGNSEVTVGTPVFGHGLMFFTGGYAPFQPIYAVKVTATGDITLKDGAETNDDVVWSTRRGGTYMPTPIVYEDYLYTCGNNGVLTCYDAKSGKRMYRARIADGKAGSYTASPVAADGKLYFSSEDSGVFVVKAGPQYELLSENPMGEIVMATPAISDGIMFVRTQHHLFGIAE